MKLKLHASLTKKRVRLFSRMKVAVIREIGLIFEQNSLIKTFFLLIYLTPNFISISLTNFSSCFLKDLVVYYCGNLINVYFCIYFTPSTSNSDWFSTTAFKVAIAC